MAERFFTQSAQNALNKSLYIARELGHTYIGSEHILLGLLSIENSVAAKLMNLRGITESHARACDTDGRQRRADKCHAR